jgi:hypothetical protein
MNGYGFSAHEEMMISQKYSFYETFINDDAQLLNIVGPTPLPSQCCPVI